MHVYSCGLTVRCHPLAYESGNRSPAGSTVWEGCKTFRRWTFAEESMLHGAGGFEVL